MWEKTDGSSCSDRWGYRQDCSHCRCEAWCRYERGKDKWMKERGAETRKWAGGMLFSTKMRVIMRRLWIERIKQQEIGGTGTRKAVCACVALTLLQWLIYFNVQEHLAQFYTSHVRGFFFCYCQTKNSWKRRDIQISSHKVRPVHTCSTETSTLLKVALQGGAFTWTGSPPPHSERIAGRLISISWMCLCTFISTSDWHFHHNYWSNHLTSDGSDLACSLRSATFPFLLFPFFNVSAGNNSTSAEIRLDWLIVWRVHVCAWPSVVHFVDLLRPRLLWMLHFLERLSLWHFVVTAQNTMQTYRKTGRQIGGHLQGVGWGGVTGGRKKGLDCSITINNVWNCTRAH